MEPSSGVWHIKDVGHYAWTQTDDIVAPMDYDGDGITDVTVYRPSKGRFLIRQSSGGYASANIGWPGSSDWPVVGDFDGDGAADVGIRRPRSWGTRWFWIKSTTGSYAYIDWGTFSDSAVTGGTGY